MCERNFEYSIEMTEEAGSEEEEDSPWLSFCFLAVSRQTKNGRLTVCLKLHSSVIHRDLALEPLNQHLSAWK